VALVVAVVKPVVALVVAVVKPAVALVVVVVLAAVGSWPLVSVSQGYAKVRPGG
jgi:hypothetical protein